jgi:hypothetical protein
MDQLSRGKFSISILEKIAEKVKGSGFPFQKSPMNYPAASGRGIKDRNPIRTFRRRAAGYSPSQRGIKYTSIV